MGDRWYFDRVARVYDYVVPPAPAGPLGDALALADGPVDRVLDVGGGTGRAAKAVSAADRVVVDVSPGMLRRVPVGVHRVLGSATDLPVADGVADAVLVVDALHHMPAQGRVVAESYRVLRPGGVLVVREVDPTTVRGRLFAAAEHALGLASTFPTIEELRGRLDAAGFEARVLDTGVSSTIAGRKPARP